MEWQEVMDLRKAIPPRQPQGSPANRGRAKFERRFTAALKLYEQEHGISWFKQPGRDYQQ